MARNTPLYFGVNGIAERLQKVYLGDSNNVSREVKKIYEGDANGIARLKYHLHEFSAGVCQVCGEPETIPTPDHTHNYSSIVIEPTCTERGYTEYTCGCGDNYKDNYVEALGHEEVIDEAVEATCTTDGLTEGSHCSRCDEVITEQEVITALGHDFDDGICTACGAIDPNCKHSDTTTRETITKEPTCTKQGSKTITVTCNICDNVVSTTTEKIPMLDHTEEAISGKTATCTETGLTEGKKCSVCGKILVAQEVIPAPGHTEQVVKGKAPTCTATGLTDGKKCTVCKKTLVEQQVIPAAHTDENDDNICDACGESLCEEHDVVIDPAVAPTCMASGLTEGSHCKVCGKVLVAQEEVKADLTDPDVHALAHLGTYCNGDHLNSGKNLYECTRDGCTYSIVLDDGLLGDAIHTNPVEHKEVPATCTANGFTAGITCNNCGADTRQLIPMLEHTEEVVAGYAATCTKTGKTDGVECSVCGTVITAQTTIPINPNNHNLKPGIPVEPTCTTHGYTPYNCTRCDYSIEGDIIAELGHNEVTVEGYDATCSSTGLTDGIKCSDCDLIIKEQETISINPSAHDRVALAYVAPTCTEDGYIPHRCKHCGDILNQVEYGTALGHTEVTDQAVAATCMNTGLTEGKHCSVCGTVTVTQNVTPVNPSNHNLKPGITVEPTCTTEGYTPYNCACGYSIRGDIITELGHKAGTAVEENRVEPTCTSNGSYDLVVYCTECGAELSRTTKTLGKVDHDTISIVTEPTCTTEGYTTYKCRKCDYSVKGDYITELGHSEVTVEGYAATCKTTGKTDGKKCSVCGTVTVAQTTIPINPNNHNLKAGIPVPATCTTSGYTPYNCTRCSYSVNGDIIAELGHSYSESVTEPTCSAPGTKKYTCSACGHSYTEEIAALGHNYVNGKCSRCGLSEGTVGCVFAGTQIALDADTSLDIADFVGGTPIDFCNPSTLEHSTQQTLARFFYEKSTDKVIITLEDGKTLELTPNHAVLTEEGFKAYLDNYDYPKYKVGDKLATVDGYKELVSIQEETVPETTVYNIATENSLMVANGIIVAGELNYNIEAAALGGDISKEEM